MKRALNNLYELIAEADFHGETITTSNRDSDVIIHHHDCGDDPWIIILEDSDVRDEHVDDKDNSKLWEPSMVNLNGDSLKALYKKLKQIFEE